MGSIPTVDSFCMRTCQVAWFAETTPRSTHHCVCGKMSAPEWHIDATWEGSRSALQSGDAVRLGRVATSLYDAWFKYAVQYAQGRLAGGADAMVRCTRHVLSQLMLVDDATSTLLPRVGDMWTSASSDGYTMR